MNQPVLVVMAAGMGSRYGGLKQLDPVGQNNQLIIDYSIYDAHRAGFETVIFVIKPEIEAAFRAGIGDRISQVMKVHYVYQRPDDLPAGYAVPEGRVTPWGTAHAVLAARHLIDGPFAVINSDDYYGPHGFQEIYRYLLEHPDRPEHYEYAMVGYLLKNTVSANGTVSRGVCQVENGHLTGVKETLKIRLDPDGTIVDEVEGTLSPDTVVSMNFWGFMPSFFDELETYFYDFLRYEAGDNCKAECLLPNLVGQRIAEKKLSVSVLHSADRWFGMTYHEDRQAVARELQRLHDAGVYPKTLHQ